MRKILLSIVIGSWAFSGCMTMQKAENYLITHKKLSTICEEKYPIKDTTGFYPGPWMVVPPGIVKDTISLGDTSRFLTNKPGIFLDSSYKANAGRIGIEITPNPTPKHSFSSIFQFEPAAKKACPAAIYYYRVDTIKKTLIDTRIEDILNNQIDSSSKVNLKLQRENEKLTKKMEFWKHTFGIPIIILLGAGLLYVVVRVLLKFKFL